MNMLLPRQLASSGQAEIVLSAEDTLRTRFTPFSLGQAKDSLWSIDLFRCESLSLRTHWVLVVMDQFTRRIIGFGIHRGTVDGPSLCSMFQRTIRGQAFPKYRTQELASAMINFPDGASEPPEQMLTAMIELEDLQSELEFLRGSAPDSDEPDAFV